jgi:hypothetical protein
MVARKRPRNIEMNPFTIEDPASMITSRRANSISEEYSGGPKPTATSAITGARNVSPTTPMVPATNEAMAAMPKAGPARPCLAISYPSRQVTTDADSPGMFSKMAVVDPPYFAP